MEAKSIINDGICLTSYSDKQTAEINFKNLQKQGRNPQWVDGAIAEKYPGMTKTQIKDKIVADIKQVQESINKFVTVTLDVRYPKK